MIQEQCNRCKKQYSCSENKVFDNNNCQNYLYKINLEKNNLAKEESSDLSSSQTIEHNIENEVSSAASQVITQDYLKSNTKIHGWLVFFLICIAIGGIFSAFYPLATLDYSEYNGSKFLAFIDILNGFFILTVAVLTIISFMERKPNAVFLGKTYVIYIFAINLLLLLIGEYSETGIGSLPHLIRSLIWGVIWFCYLCFSSQVEEVIPKEYRKKSKFDYWVVGVLVFVPLFAFVYAISSALATSYSDNDFIEITSVKTGEYTDGKMAFSLPQDFECNISENEGLKIFELSNSGLEYCIIVSDFEEDQSPQNINNYWRNCEDGDLAIYKKGLIANEKRFVNNMPYYYKVTKYEIDNSFVYWRFIMLFDNESSKVCLMSCYDCGFNDYVEDLLQSIRFK